MTGMKNKQEYEEELEMGKGGFTLPGESGYEELTLKMAEKWGADVIRDSDGTVLSDEITHAGYGIYSTICIIRDHNAWAKENQDKLQQTFLCTPPHIVSAHLQVSPVFLTGYLFLCSLLVKSTSVLFCSPAFSNS